MGKRLPRAVSFSFAHRCEKKNVSTVGDLAEQPPALHSACGVLRLSITHQRNCVLYIMAT